MMSISDKIYHRPVLPYEQWRKKLMRNFLLLVGGMSIAIIGGGVFFASMFARVILMR